MTRTPRASPAPAPAPGAGTCRGAGARALPSPRKTAPAGDARAASAIDAEGALVRRRPGSRMMFCSRFSWTATTSTRARRPDARDDLSSDDEYEDTEVELRRGERRHAGRVPAAGAAATEAGLSK